ncbi:MAG TPA: thiamine pyrophosphate-binding protein [Ktedonobacteraceae bacterium]|nr:thiamine pyrophosphate-binding protein [Ktedonobacteraceae bacterium]
MASISGAQALIATLRSHGVDTLFGIPGVHTLPIYDVLYREPGLRHVLARHEQGAGFMADGYARVSAKPGVVCTITGPGVTNVATPVASAYADSVPLLVISTSLPRASVGRQRGELHEVKDQFGMMEALAGWARVVTQVEEIPDALRAAFRAMRSSRARGAYLQIPLDLLMVEAEMEIPEPAPATPPCPSQEQVAALVRMLTEAERPLIIAGAGVSRAGANDHLARLAGRLGAPVLLGHKSHDVLSADHPLVITMTSYGMPDEMRALLAESDMALVVGSKLGAGRTSNGRLVLPKTLAQIDIDPAEIGRQYPVSLGIMADARLALDALLAALQETPRQWVSRAAEVATAREAIQTNVRRVFGESIDLLAAVREGLPPNGLVVADMTMLGYASAEYLPVYEPHSYIHASELCSIGCGLPMAIGAKAGTPQRPVVTLCGDGGFLLNVGELATAVQEQLDVVVVIFNDSTYTAVKRDQARRFGRRYIATDLQAPDYVALARAFNMKGVRVESPRELSEAVQDATTHPGSTLIDVPLPPRQW